MWVAHVDIKIEEVDAFLKKDRYLCNCNIQSKYVYDIQFAQKQKQTNKQTTKTKQTNKFKIGTQKQTHIFDFFLEITKY